MPGVNIEKALVEAARKRRMGKQALAGIFCQENPFLEYGGPTDPDELWELPEYRLAVGVKVQTSKVIRTRPKFDQWAARVVIEYDASQVNGREVRELMKIAGESIGLCDWRPKYGRFVVEE